MSSMITGGWLTRRSDRGPVSCAVCGCRLADAKDLEGTAWRHFQITPDSDARGCRTPCLGDLHDRDGRVLQLRSLESLMSAEPDPAPA